MTSMLEGLMRQMHAVRAWIESVVANTPSDYLLMWGGALAALLWAEARYRRRRSWMKQADEVVALINREHATVLDVRDRKAYDEGHVAGALHVPEALRHDDALVQHCTSDKPVVFVCADGRASLDMCARMRALGRTEVFVLYLGMHAWREVHLPCVTAS